MKKPNVKPLRSALSKVEEMKAKSIDFSSRLETFQKEIEDQENNLELGDLVGIRNLAKKKLELESVPRMMDRFKQEIGNAVLRLAAEVQTFERELLDAAAAEKEEMIQQIADVIQSRGWATKRTDPRNGEILDDPRNIAASMPALRVFPESRIEGASLPHKDRLLNRDLGEPANIERLDRDVIACANKLIEIFEKWRKNGGSFLPK